MLRYFLPKRKAFPPLTQKDATLIINHINSVKRESLNNRSPYEVAKFFNYMTLFEKMECKAIAPDEVVLNASLLPIKRSTHHTPKNTKSGHAITEINRCTYNGTPQNNSATICSHVIFYYSPIEKSMVKKPKNSAVTMAQRNSTIRAVTLSLYQFVKLFLQLRVKYSRNRKRFRLLLKSAPRSSKLRIE